jgi:hypothetical protein
VLQGLFVPSIAPIIIFEWIPVALNGVSPTVRRLTMEVVAGHLSHLDIIPWSAIDEILAGHLNRWLSWKSSLRHLSGGPICWTVSARIWKGGCLWLLRETCYGALLLRNTPFDQCVCSGSFAPIGMSYGHFSWRVRVCTFSFSCSLCSPVLFT